MKQASATRKFNGKVYKLISNPYGDNSRSADILKDKYSMNGYGVRIIVNNSQPYIYPEGRYFVYVRKNVHASP